MNSETMPSHKYEGTKVKVERIYVGSRTTQELIIELIKKHREVRDLLP